MLKNKLDYKLINFALIALIAFLFYQAGSLLKEVLDKILDIVLPFLFAFAIAYAVYPTLKKIDVLNITPIDAINILSKLKEKVKWTFSF